MALVFPDRAPVMSAVPANLALEARFDEDYRPYQPRGDVFFLLEDMDGNVLERREHRNLVVKDASILLARLAKDNQEPTKGLFVLAVGTGDTGWNPLAPPAATNTQRALYAEIARKTFMTTTFIDSGGLPSAIPTNVVDFTTQFVESEAVGPLVEMGLLGGTISTNLNTRNPVVPPNGPYNAGVDLTVYETMFNYLTFGAITKPAVSKLMITWRITF